MKAFSEMVDDLSDYVPDVSSYAHRAADYLSDSASSMSDHLPDIDAKETAYGLGFASLAIGLAEIAAPKQVNDLLGIEDTPDRRGTLRALGVREIASGLAILGSDGSKQELATGVWARVAGDVLDTAMLGIAGAKTKKPMQFAIVAALVGAIGLADFLTAKKLSQ